MRTAWNIDGGIHRSLATDHLHSTFEFSSPSSEDEDEDEDFASPRDNSSDIQHAVKGLSVKYRSILKYTPPLITSDRQASPETRTPPLVAVEAKSAFLLTLVSTLTMRRDCIQRVRDLHHFAEISKR